MPVWLEVLIKSVILLFVVVTSFAYAMLAERKILGWMQLRPGPNRVGPWGLMQPAADAAKLILKEDLTPATADPLIYRLAPFISLFTAFAVYAVIPFGSSASGGTWGVGNGNAGIVAAQNRWWFVVPQLVGFIVYIITAVAETNRTPFDLVEAETELVAGFHTEYSGLRFGLFFIAEYVNMLTVSCIATLLFFGGWNAPLHLTFVPGVAWFVIKVACFMFFYMWLRATLPRLRYDRLMAFGWKVLFPVAMLNLVVTAIVVAYTG